MTSNTFNLGQGVTTFGIAWDMKDGQSVDLDMFAVCYDTTATLADVAYFNQPSILNGAVAHSGDNTTGVGDNDDETITVRFAGLQSIGTVFLIVNAFKTGDFTRVKTGKFRVYMNNNQPAYEYCLGCGGNNTSLLIGYLRRGDYGDWFLQTLEEPGNGRNFVESAYMMESKLPLIFPQETLAKRRDPKKTYTLQKNDQYRIDGTVKYAVLGLGWDPAPGFNIDVDASIVAFGSDVNFNEAIYFGHKNGLNNAIVHSGDNRTGNGDGDDETIQVNFGMMPQHIATLICCVNIYSGSASFKNIKRCYARLFVPIPGTNTVHELCRFNLSETQNSSGMIMCTICRTSTGVWELTCNGDAYNCGVVTQGMAQLKTVAMSLQQIPPPPPLPLQGFALTQS